ncbi:MAG TPA: lipid II flippase MurJ [Candidatus Paceibacterota bacterium]
MVSKILEFLNQSTEGLHQAAFLLGFSAIISQVLALLRDRLLAHTFGAGSVLDVYYAAFKIPDYIYVTIASIVSVTILLPFIVERQNGDKERIRKFLNSIFTLFSIIIVVVAVVAFFLIPKITDWIVPGFSSDKISQFVTLSRILLLSPILLGLSNLLGSITQSYQKFFVYAMTPVLYNIGIILGIVVFYPLFGLQGLVWGVVLGALLHFAIQIPTVAKLGLLPSLRFSIDWAEIKQVLISALPRTVTLSIHSIVIILLTNFASKMIDGSIAVFNFSYNLETVPLSIVGISYSVAAFPALAKFFSTGERAKFIAQVSAAARHIIFWSVPIAALFIVLRAQVVRTILGSGQFDWTSTRLVAALLALFSFSIVAQSLNLLFVRAYYAAGNTLKPLIINVASSVLVIASAFLFLNLWRDHELFRYFFESLFRVTDVSGTIVLMLALAFSVGLLVNLIIFWITFEKDFPSFTKEVGQTLRHSIYAAVLMGFVARQFLEVLDNIFDINTLPGIFLQGFIAGLFGIIAGVFLLKLLGNREIVDIYHAFHTKFWKAKPVQPSPEEIIS